MNLLEETLAILKKHGKTENDILWVGSLDFCFNWDKFKENADIGYDDSFGGQEVAEDLLVVGDNFWLERHEYGSSEWWEFKELPKRPLEQREVFKLKGNGWTKLKELNGIKPL